MSVSYDDYTPDIAEAYDDVREELAAGARLFLLEQTEPGSTGLRAIELDGDPNGEVLAGWMPRLSFDRRRLTLSLTILGRVTRAAIQRMFAVAVAWPPTLGVATVYIVQTPIVVPSVESARVVEIEATLTARTFTPTTVGVFEYTFDYALA